MSTCLYPITVTILSLLIKIVSLTIIHASILSTVTSSCIPSARVSYTTRLARAISTAAT